MSINSQNLLQKDLTKFEMFFKFELYCYSDYGVKIACVHLSQRWHEHVCLFYLIRVVLIRIINSIHQISKSPISNEYNFPNIPLKVSIISMHTGIKR